jgi:hypothetical protein
MIDRQILRVQEQAKQLPAGNQIDPFEADDASDLKSPHTALRPPSPPSGSLHHKFKPLKRYLW